MSNAVFIADTRAFLIGTVLIQIKENTNNIDKAIIYHSGLTEAEMQRLNRIMPCIFVNYKCPLPEKLFKLESFAKFSPLMFARYEMFKYLKDFERIMYIDTDILIQKNINELIYEADKTGFAMISESAFDNSYSSLDINATNFRSPIFKYKMDSILYCSALIVINRSIGNWEKYPDWCYSKTEEFAKKLNLPDQGILNLFIQEFDIKVKSISSSKYALYPKHGRDCSNASILHSWGSRKFWNSWYLFQKYPMWNEYYKKWVNLGGCQNPAELKPDISVIIPAYKPNLEFFSECMESLFNQKRYGFDYDNFEIIIVAEPFNIEELTDFVKKYDDPRIKLLINETRLGISASLNRGIKEACGKYIARMDDDDIASDDRLYSQFELLESRPDIHLCTSNHYYFGDMNEGRKAQRGEDAKALALLTCPFDHPTVMFRKDFFEKNNLFYDESRFFVEDWELWCRAFDKGMKVEAIDRFLLKHRWYNGQAGQNNMTERIMLLQRGNNIYKNFGIIVSNSACRDISPYRGKIKKIKMFRLTLLMCRIFTVNLFKKKYNNIALLKILLWRLNEAWTGNAIPKKLKKMKAPF